MLPPFEGASPLLETYAPDLAWLETVLHNPALDTETRRGLLTTCLVRAAANGNADLLDWIISHTELASPSGKDGDGVPALVLATCMGHSDCVRLLVEAGCDVDGQDSSGWTALHWAVQSGANEMAAYLLNHNASMAIKSHKDLLPIDLVRRGKEGDTMREIIGFAEEQPRHRAQSLERTLSSKAHGKQRDENDSDVREKQRLLEAARECARHLDIDLDALGLGKPRAGPDVASTSTETFRWDACDWDQMLVFTHDRIPSLLTVIVDEAVIDPNHTAADIMYLCARYAALLGPEDLLDEFFERAFARIIDVIVAVPNNMAFLAYWLSNMLTLLHYLRRDTQLNLISAQEDVHGDSVDSQEAVTIESSVQYKVICLINDLLIHILRGVERRLDAVLDAAMLEYESLPFEEVRFEGEWRISKVFSSRAKRESLTPSSVLSIFTGSDVTSPPAPERPLRRGTSLTNIRTPPSPSDTSHSPRTVTAVLSALLFVLQQYRLPAWIILQALSQVLYWLSCELFNHMITRKRHLCKSRAVQIRLNVSSLEEWARTNHLPTRLVNRPFEPLNALLQWLQCLSSEQSLENLFRTLFNMQALNALQLQRAMIDYRYEVDEPHISQDCLQYVSQMAADFEKRKMRLSTQYKLDTRSDASSFEERERRNIAVTAHIDEVFGPDGTGLSAYEPPEPPECLDELLDSRYMLPLGLPSDTSLLMPEEASTVFGPLAKGSIRLPQTDREVVPRPPDGLLAALDAAAERASAAQAVYLYNQHAAHGLALGLSPTISGKTQNGWHNHD